MSNNSHLSPSSEAYNSDQYPHPDSNSDSLQLQSSSINKSKETAEAPQENNFQRVQAPTATQTQMIQEHLETTFSDIQGKDQFSADADNDENKKWEPFSKSTSEESDLQKNLERKVEPKPLTGLTLKPKMTELIESKQRMSSVVKNIQITLHDAQTNGSDEETKSAEPSTTMLSVQYPFSKRHPTTTSQNVQGIDEIKLHFPCKESYGVNFSGFGPALLNILSRKNSEEQTKSIELQTPMQYPHFQIHSLIVQDTQNSSNIAYSITKKYAIKSLVECVRKHENLQKIHLDYISKQLKDKIEEDLSLVFNPISYIKKVIQVIRKPAKITQNNTTAQERNHILKIMKIIHKNLKSLNLKLAHDTLGKEIKRLQAYQREERLDPQNYDNNTWMALRLEEIER